MKNVDKKRSCSFCMSCFEENGLVVGEGEWSEGVQPLVSPAVNMPSEDKNKDVAGSFSRKNKLGRRSFSRYVKAVLFDISLMKKMRDQKSGQKFSRTYGSAKSKPKKIFNSKSTNNISLMSNNTEEDNRSTPSSSFSSCSCTTSAATDSSSSATASRCSSLSDSVENSMHLKVGNYGFHVGICSFLISLLVLVICGKVSAIICTSTWLFFAFRWRTVKRASSEKIAVDRLILLKQH